MTDPNYEAELTRAAERLQAALGDYMGVGLLCVDAAIERVVQERDRQTARIAELTAALAEAEAMLDKLARLDAQNMNYEIRKLLSARREKGGAK